MGGAAAGYARGPGLTVASAWRAHLEARGARANDSGH